MRVYHNTNNPNTNTGPLIAPVIEAHMGETLWHVTDSAGRHSVYTDEDEARLHVRTWLIDLRNVTIPTLYPEWRVLEFPCGAQTCITLTEPVDEHPFTEHFFIACYPSVAGSVARGGFRPERNHA